VTETVPGTEIDESLGAVRGNTVAAPSDEITQSLWNITGGELTGDSELLTETPDTPPDRDRGRRARGRCRGQSGSKPPLSWTAGRRKSPTEPP